MSYFMSWQRKKHLFTKDHYSGADFAKKEVQDDHGVVTGEYR